jgi:hypothetical protein
MNLEENLRSQKLSFLIGTMLGQINELLNQISSNRLSIENIYESLLDISNAASLQVHELYYKEEK